MDYYTPHLYQKWPLYMGMGWDNDMTALGDFTSSIDQLLTRFKPGNILCLSKDIILEARSHQEGGYSEFDLVLLQLPEKFLKIQCERAPHDENYGWIGLRDLHGNLIFSSDVLTTRFSNIPIYNTEYTEAHKPRFPKYAKYLVQLVEQIQKELREKRMRWRRK